MKKIKIKKETLFLFKKKSGLRKDSIQDPTTATVTITGITGTIFQ